jgi:hypothetical protein
MVMKTTKMTKRRKTMMNTTTKRRKWTKTNYEDHRPNEDAKKDMIIRLWTFLRHKQTVVVGGVLRHLLHLVVVVIHRTTNKRLFVTNRKTRRIGVNG